MSFEIFGFLRKKIRNEKYLFSGPDRLPQVVKIKLFWIYFLSPKTVVKIKFFICSFSLGPSYLKK